MRKNILVIGGTRYFGKLLVQRLINAGHQVTIAGGGVLFLFGFWATLTDGGSE